MTWNTVPLGNILVQSSNHKQIEPGQSYKQITVRLWGKGLVLRGVCDGAEISANRQIAAQTGDFIISKIDARHGAFGLVPAELNDALVSNDFPCFKVNEEALAPSYLKWYAKTEAFVALCKQSSVGSTNRVRLKEGRFLELEIPLPSLDEQHVIARCLDSISDGVIEASNLADAALADLHALVFSLHESLSEPEQVSLGSLIELDERIEIVEDDGEYPQLGIRSFGNGLFFKDAVNPTMRYSGGMKVALEKNWITPASGKYGPGHSPGAAIGEAQSWIDQYNFAQAAAWVRDKFKFKQNDIWELLATIDYAMLALSHQGTNPTSQAVLSYIDQDPEWHPKIAKLGLTEPAIQNAMVELESLFPAAQGAR